MKILGSITSLYNERIEYYNLLKQNVDGLILQTKENYWHYESRVKKINSFALKFETGRFSLENIFDDAFAGTIVVRNSEEILGCIKYLKTHFEVIEQRPQNRKFTHKDTYSFEFDDLRLIIKLKDDQSGRFDEHLLELKFEIQIKTFLQHAWSVATHDLIYKTDTVNWAKERVAYHVKAALEQAELTISSVDEIIKSSLVNKNNRKVNEINKIISFIKEVFPEDSLPTDLRRLSENINALMKVIGLTLSDLKFIIEIEKECDREINLLNLSPFQNLLRIIHGFDENYFIRFLTDNHQSTNYKLVVFPELELNFSDIPNVLNDRLVVVSE